MGYEELLGSTCGKFRLFYLFRLFIFFSLLRNPSRRKWEGEGKGCPESISQSLHSQGWKDPLHSLNIFPSSWNFSSLRRLIPAWTACATISTWTLTRFIYINQQVTLKLKCTNIVNRIPSIYSKWTLESTRNWNNLSLVVSLLCIKN